MPMAVLFDLDGTLLDLDMDRFMSPYMNLLGQAVSGFVAKETFYEHLMRSVNAMIVDQDEQKTNEDVFWEAFYRLTGVGRDDVGLHIDRFYKNDFSKLGSVAKTVPFAARVVSDAVARSKHVVLATNPIFPRAAIIERLRWAAVDPNQFSLITTYENMHACKPNEAYYLEICSMIGVEPRDAVMIGNDLKMDIQPAARLGMATYYVEDVAAPGKTESAFVSAYAEATGDGSGDGRTVDTEVADTKTADTKTANTKTADTRTAGTQTADTDTADIDGVGEKSLPKQSTASALHARGRLRDVTAFLDRLIDR